ncbi:acyltransferase [Arthrobacter rhizosphaerae]|uniref:acyltransferase n=1 Tax=Arthrobacter rhizosphaerae TaxID=2855490 RepID=UPI001FF5C445|nr:acyltransferase [Arthrobacter rhizosphaerae]
MTSINTRRSRIPAPLHSVTRWALNKVATGSKVRVGRGLRAGLGSRISSIHGLEIGDHVSIGPGSLIEVDGYIGDFVLIARNVQIVGRMDHDIGAIGVPVVRATWVGDRDALPEDAVRIERDVWIGAGVIVLGGVTIGEGSIIGAGSLVSKDIPPYSVAVGSPARRISGRFASEAECIEHSKGLDVLTE